MVDAFVSQDGDRFECRKNVSHNEPFFQGHFPGEPVLPGGADRRGARTGGCGRPSRMREGWTAPETEPRIGYLVGVDEAKFKRKVVPGDVLRLTGTILMFRRRLCRVAARALVGEEVAAEATLSFVFAA